MSDLLKQWEQNWKAVEDADKAAKAAGQLLGRYIDHPYADGAAIYRIVKVNKRTVRIEVVTGLGDDWVLPAWGDATTIPLAQAQQFVTRRDSLAKLFATKGATR